MKKTGLKTLYILGVLLFWAAVWFFVSYKVNNAFLFPDPREVLATLGSLMREKSFWKISLTSLWGILKGILIATFAGVLLAILTTKIKPLDVLLRPLMTVVKSTPIASFIILAIIWMKRQDLPVFITILIVIPIVWSNVTEGLKSVDKNLADVAKVYKFSVFEKIRYLYIPTVLPFFMAAVKSVLGMAWKAGIAAEVLATPPDTIGRELYYSKTYMETNVMFAWTLVVILLSLIIEKILIFGIEKLTRKLKFSRGEERVAK